MLYKRKFLYKRETVDGVRELDYLQTELFNQQIGVDFEYTINQSTAFRPDLIARQTLGNFHYGWLIMDYNDILDPYEELFVGRTLRIPKIDEYFEFYNENSVISKEDRR